MQCSSREKRECVNTISTTEKATKRNYIVLNEKQVFNSIAISSSGRSRKSYISTRRELFFLMYLVAKSTSLVKLDAREQNLIPSVTRELALFKG